MDHCSSLICFLEASKNSYSSSFILNFHDNCFTSGDFSTSSLWSFPLCCFLCSNRFSHFLISCLFLFLFSLLEFSACIAQHVFVFCIFFKCFVVGAKSCPTLVTPWTVAHQASLAMGFPRQECWDGLPFNLLQGLFLTLRLNPCLLKWQVDSFTALTREMLTSFISESSFQIL